MHSSLNHISTRFLYERGPNVANFNLPPNGALQGLTKGLAKAWELYGSKTSVVVMVVQPGERNSFDQRWLENTLLTQYGVKLLRKSLAELLEQGKLVGSERKLILNGEHEVAVAYYRAGYAPTDYPSENEWDARLLVERSHAIKCPNAAYHLVGSKKIQQILAEPGVLEQFIPSTKHVRQLRSCFTGLWPLDASEAGRKAYEMALQSPERFVLKPQREGGGNNIYGADIKAELLKLTENERNAYILMELIKPPPSRSVLVRNGEIIEGDVISELGIYGVWVSEDSVVHMNEGVGHLLRTKVANSNEGGVAAGYSVLDSPNLV
ncbi:glutathione synthase [Chytriomyces sp. MP71]|nr:glutathione synthase [Chytriomyces sp. MP71]